MGEALLEVEDRRNAVEGEAERTLTPGDVFHEPPGAPIARFDNASQTAAARFVAYYPLAGDQQPLTPLD